MKHASMQSIRASYRATKISLAKKTRASRITENKGTVPPNCTTTHRSHQGAKKHPGHSNPPKGNPIYGWMICCLPCKANKTLPPSCVLQTHRADESSLLRCNRLNFFAPMFRRRRQSWPRTATFCAGPSRRRRRPHGPGPASSLAWRRGASSCWGALRVEQQGGAS